MATAHYNDQRQGWELNWVNEKKKKEGHPKPYGRKFITDRTYPKMTKKERQLVYNKWLSFALDQEQKCRCLIDGTDLNREISAVSYFETLEKVAKSGSCTRTVAKNRRIVDHFAKWLKENHPSILLHQINRAIATEYLNDLATGFKRYTVESYRNSLQYVMGLVVLQMEDSDLKYRNGFGNLNLDDVLNVSSVVHKKNRFDVDDYRNLIARATTYELRDPLIIMWLTGWRISDVLNLRESQIDRKENTLTLFFQKTINSTKQSVTIPLLAPLKEIFDRHSNESGFFFPEYSDIYQETGDWRRANKWRKGFMKEVISIGLGDAKTYTLPNGTQKTMMCFTPHSVRGTVISLLSESGYVEPLVNHLVGHSSGSINQKHYMTFTADTVRPMMETLWEFIK